MVNGLETKEAILKIRRDVLRKYFLTLFLISVGEKEVSAQRIYTVNNTQK